MNRLLAACLLFGCGGGDSDPIRINPDGGQTDQGVELDAQVTADVGPDRDDGVLPPDSAPPADAGLTSDAGACEPTGFGSEGVRWTFPNGLEGPLYALGGGGPRDECDAMKYSLLNLRGGGLDLVVTHDCEAGSGHRFWRVYGNTGGGFANAGARWTLPEGFDPNEFASAAGGDPNDCETPSYSVVDLRGEGRPDLVVTFDCERGSGESFWRVYRNNGSGFANAGVRWALPPGFGADAFIGLAAINEDDCSKPSYALLDLTADGPPDLVVTQDCEMGTGQSHWWVYPNNGNGFAQAPRRWSIPQLVPGGKLVRLADVQPREECDRPSYALADLDGDGALDLVLTHDCENGSAQTHWRVFRNTGEGFANASQRWPLPSGFGANTFYSLAHVEPRESCDPISYSLLDLTRDGRADLVVTHDCEDMGSGTTTWRVYENQGDGFASAGKLWSLPNGFDDNTFYSLGAQVVDDCDPPSYSVLDLDGDDRLEIVVTHDCIRGNPHSGGEWGSGETFWRRYDSVCQ